MKFQIWQPQEISINIEIATWLKENVGPYADFNLVLGHYEGRGWSMKSVKILKNQIPGLSTYQWVWEIEIEDDKLAIEFAMRFL